MKKRCLCLAALLCLLAASVRADAANFVEIGRDDEGSIYLDTESVRERDGNIVAWSKHIPRGEISEELKKAFGKKVECTKEFWAFRKDDRQFKILTATFYYSDGTLETFSEPFGAVWEEIVPETVGELTYNSVMIFAGY